MGEAGCFGRGSQSGGGSCLQKNIPLKKRRFEKSWSVCAHFFVPLVRAMNSFLATITQPLGLDESQLCFIEQWFEALNVKYVSSREQHKSGNWHSHTMFEDPNKATAGVTRKLKRAFGFTMDLTPRHALDVRKVKTGDEVRTAGYVVKDDMVLGCNGWNVKDLLKQRATQLREQVDKKPTSTFMLNEKNVEELMLEYAKRTGTVLNVKNDFVDMVADMVSEGYSFSRVKLPIVYAQVMCRAGSKEHMRDFVRMQLGNLM